MIAITVSIETDNDAFAGSQRTREVSRILREAVARLSEEGYGDDCFKVRDVNGNTVGSVIVVNHGGGAA